MSNGAARTGNAYAHTLGHVTAVRIHMNEYQSHVRPTRKMHIAAANTRNAYAHRATYPATAAPSALTHAAYLHPGHVTHTGYAYVEWGGPYGKCICVCARAYHACIHSRPKQRATAAAAGSAPKAA